MQDAKLSALLDDDDFWRIQHSLSHFNLFEAVGAVSGELKHSNFLRYILSPTSPHGLGTQSLHAFLRMALDIIPSEKRPLSTLELTLADLDGAVIHRERDNIDLLVEVPELMLLVVIENKIRAKAGTGQLEGYRASAEQRFPNYRKLHLFLTPDGHSPDDDAYHALSYAELANVLEALVLRVSPPDATRLILDHYVAMLRKHIVGDEKLMSLAAKLYERHSEALEYIFTHRPRGASLLGGLEEQISACSGLSIETSGSNIVRFYPDDWDEHLAFRSPHDAWTKSGRGLLFEIKTFNDKPGRVLLSLVLGPGPERYREALYDAAKCKPDLFEGLVKPRGRLYASIFSKELQSELGARTLSMDAQLANLQLAWSAFQGGHLPKLIDQIISLDAEIAPKMLTE